MKLGRNGEIIISNGFDGGTYSPRHVSRTSVYLGDMSREDMRVKAEVASREEAARREDLRAAAAMKRMEQRKIAVREKIKAALAARELVGAHKMELARAAGYEAARKSSRQADITPWVGSGFAGFGDPSTEQRINPDGAEDIAIVDAAIPEVAEYGINSWMEDASTVEAAVKDAAAAYTQGKVQMATLLDYARSPETSVVGMPLSAQSILAKNQEVVEHYASDVVNAVGSNNEMVKYGVMALAAWILLR